MKWTNFTLSGLMQNKESGVSEKENFDISVPILSEYRGNMLNFPGHKNDRGMRRSPDVTGRIENGRFRLGEPGRLLILSFGAAGFRALIRRAAALVPAHRHSVPPPPPPK